MGLWVVVNPLVMFIIFVASIVEQIVDPLQYDAYQNVSADTAVCAAVNVAGTALFSGPAQLQSLPMGIPPSFSHFQWVPPSFSHFQWVPPSFSHFQWGYRPASVTCNGPHPASVTCNGSRPASVTCNGSRPASVTCNGSHLPFHHLQYMLQVMESWVGSGNKAR